MSAAPVKKQDSFSLYSHALLVLLKSISLEDWAQYLLFFRARPLPLRFAFPMNILVEEESVEVVRESDLLAVRSQTPSFIRDKTLFAAPEAAPPPLQKVTTQFSGRGRGRRLSLFLTSLLLAFHYVGRRFTTANPTRTSVRALDQCVQQRKSCADIGIRHLFEKRFRNRRNALRKWEGATVHSV